MPNTGPYLAKTGTGQNTIIPVPPIDFLLLSSAFRANDAANVVGGFDRIDANFASRVWTPEIGWTDLDAFLHAQGTWMEGTGHTPIQAMSADGRIWVLGGFNAALEPPLIIEIPKAIVCHKAPGSTQAPKNLDVTFPDGLAEHLNHGDTLGLCPYGGD